MSGAPAGAGFRKYAEEGAYHWHATYSGGWRRSSPVAHARYDVLLGQLARRVDLPTALGLDVGCGDGVMLYKVRRRGGRAVGVDLELDGLAAGREELRRAGAPAPLACGSGYALPFRDGAFDYVTAAEIIEHLDRPGDWLAEVRRVLRRGGVLALTTPHQLPSGELHDVYHCREYDGPALRRELEAYFPEVQVRGQYPRLLYDLYVDGVRVRPLDVGVRLGLKVLASAGLNPFTLWTTRAPDARWDGLVALARKR